MQTRREGFLLVVALLCLVTAVVTFLLWRTDQALVSAVRQEIAELRTELASRDKTVSDLQTRVDESFERPPTQITSPITDSFPQLTRRINELTAQQNMTLALVQSLVSTSAQAESSEFRQQRQQLAIGALEERLRAQQVSLDAAKQKVEQLAITWNVPDEVARMETSDGLDISTLKQYWPYFEARRERQQLEKFVSLLKMKLAAEKIDLAVEAAKDISQ